MDWLHFTWFDWAATGAVALSAIMAFARGFIRELFTIFGFVGGAIAGFLLAEPLRPIVESFTSLRGPMAQVAGGFLVFLIVFIVVTVATAVWAQKLHKNTEIGSFDRAAGLAFGILRGVVFVSALVLLLMRVTGSSSGVPSPQAAMPEDITNARTFPIYQSVARVGEILLPIAREEVHNTLEERRRRASESANTTTGTSTATTTSTTTSTHAAAPRH